MSRAHSFVFFARLALIAAAAETAAAAPKFNPALLDPRYPDMIEWAKAGVTGGLPANLPIAAQAKPGDDLQALIDATAAPTALRVHDSPARVIQLAPGEYPLTTTLLLRSGIVLRGAPDGRTKLHVKLRSPYRPAAELGPDGFSTWTTGILGRDVDHAGLEDLTVSYDESLPPPPTLPRAPAAFINDPRGATDLWVVAVRFTLARDCWLLRCKVLNSGTHPIMVEASSHLTIADTEVSGAYNKGEGAGYFNITRSAYIRLDGIGVRAIRHFAFQNTDDKFPCRYNVLIRAHLEVDVNFCNGDGGHNLVENCIIAVPASHWWPPLGAGIPGQNLPPGPGNLIYHCSATRAFTAADRNFSIADDPERVYAVRDRLEKGGPIVRPAGDSPHANTLYPVR